MRKNNSARGAMTRGGLSSHGGRTRGSTSVRSLSAPKSTLVARGSPISTLTARGESDASPIRSTVVTRGGLTNRGRGKDPLLRIKDGSMEKNGSKKYEKKIYKVSLTKAVVDKLIAAKSKGVRMKINAFDKVDKMEICTGEGEKIRLDLSSPKKAEMIFIRNDDIVEPVGNVIGCASTTIKSHAAAKQDLAVKKDQKVKDAVKKLRESQCEETKRKRRVQVLEIDKVPSEQEVRTKSKRQKNNTGSSMKAQQSPSIPSNKISSQPPSVTRGGKSLRGKVRVSQTRISINTTAPTEVANIDEESTTTTASVRGSNTTRSGKTTGGGKSTRGRGGKTTTSDSHKVNAPAAQSTTSTRGKRGRPAGVTNKTTRGAKTYTMTTRTSAAFKTSAIVKNDNDQLSMSEGTTSSSSKKGKGKANGQPASSEWQPGQAITILTEFKQARKKCEELENNIQELFGNLDRYEDSYNTYANSIKNVKGSTNDLVVLLKDIEKQFGNGSPANELMQKYYQLEKEIQSIYDELWRVAEVGLIDED